MKTILTIIVITITSITLQSCDSDDDNNEVDQCPTAQEETTTAQTAYNLDNTNESLCNDYNVDLKEKMITHKLIILVLQMKK